MTVSCRSRECSTKLLPVGPLKGTSCFQRQSNRCCNKLRLHHLKVCLLRLETCLLFLTLRLLRIHLCLQMLCLLRMKECFLRLQLCSYA